MGGGAVDTEADCDDVVVGIVDELVVAVLVVVGELVAAVLVERVAVVVEVAAGDENDAEEPPQPAIAAAAVTDASAAVSRATSAAIGTPARRCNRLPQQLDRVVDRELVAELTEVEI